MNKQTFTPGWLPQPHDPRDLHFSISSPKKLPARIDLSPHCGEILNQYSLGSCTANAIASAVFNAQVRAKQDPFVASRLFIYYNERRLEGTINEDAGAYIRDGFKVINKLGAPQETLWPYNLYKWRNQPPVPVYSAALKNKATKYYALPGSVQSVKEALASGYPVVFGFLVYDSFWKITKRKPVMPMPNPNGESIAGGHAVIAVGYSNARKAFKIQNSWGNRWADKGYFWMPFDFFELSGGSNVADFWVVELMERF